jgi:hypothetical protein
MFFSFMGVIFLALCLYTLHSMNWVFHAMYICILSMFYGPRSEDKSILSYVILSNMSCMYVCASCPLIAVCCRWLGTPWRPPRSDGRRSPQGIPWRRRAGRERRASARATGRPQTSTAPRSHRALQQVPRVPVRRRLPLQTPRQKHAAAVTDIALNTVAPSSSWIQHSIIRSPFSVLRC